MERSNTGWMRFKSKEKEPDSANAGQAGDVLYKEILDSLPDHIVKLDLQLNVLWANLTALTLSSEPCGEKCFEAFLSQHVPCENCPCIKAMSSGVTEKSVIGVNTDDEAAASYFEIIAVPQKDVLGNVVSVLEISRDVTERISSNKLVREQSEQLNKAMDSFREESEKRCNFILNLSSEVKEDLEDISDQLSFIKHQADAKDVEWVEPLIQISERLMRKVGNVNDFFSMEEARVQLLYVPFELSELIDEVYNRFKVMAREKSTIIEVSASAGVPKKLIGDIFRIQAILMNIVENSVEHTQNGKIKINFFAQSKLEGKQVRLQIVVTDTGVGFTDEKLELIQMLFSDKAPKDFFDQAIAMQGLGLLTAYNMLKAMNGDIEIESQYGRGAVVKLYMDLGVKAERIDMSRIQPIREEELPKEASSTFLRKILIAEDDVVSRVSYKIHLQNHYELIYAKSGREAVELYLTEKPELVFMSIMLPEMNGFEAFDEIERTSRRRVPIIACTNKVIESEREYLISYGFTDYLPKPIEAAGINKIIGKYLK